MMKSLSRKFKDGKTFDKIIAVLSLLSYVYFFILFFLMNGVAFSEFFFLLGTFFLIWFIFTERIRKCRWIRMILTIAGVIVLSVFIIIEGMIIAYPKDTDRGCDYLIVLGARVMGNEPGLTLKGRLERAIVYSMNSDDDFKIVVSGGKGDGENISEAEAMKRYLVANGIDEEKIIKEDKSVNTQQNFMFSKEKIENDSGKDINSLNINAVTTDFHAYRGGMYANKCGYDNVEFMTQPSKWYLIPVMYTREFFAILKAYIVMFI